MHTQAQPPKKRKLRLEDVSSPSPAAEALPHLQLGAPAEFRINHEGDEPIPVNDEAKAMLAAESAPRPRPSPMAEAAAKLLATPLKAVAPVSFEVPVGALFPSPFNPRQDFDAGLLRELAASFKTQGVLEPLLVRPLYVAGLAVEGKWEIVDGERRWRSAKLAKLVTVPVVVRELSDEWAKEAQLVANIQRESLSALELGRGYRALRDGHGQLVDDIAAKVGKSRSSVYDAIKLTELGPKAQAAVNTGKLKASTALLVAAVPAGKQQEAALEAVEGKTVEEARLVIKTRFALELSKAPFALGDAQLVPAAGACTSCEKRTGCQVELFAQGAKEKDLCLDSACYEKKAAEMVERARHDHRIGKGPRVLSKAEAAEAFDAYGSLRGSAYKDPEEKCYQDEKYRPLRQLLGRELAGQMVLAENPTTHHLIELLDVEGLKPALERAGRIKRRKADEPPAKKAAPASKPVPNAEDELDAKVRDAMPRALAVAVATAAEGKKADKAFWRWLVGELVRSDVAGVEAALEMHGLVETTLKRWVDRAEEREVRGLAVVMLLADRIFSFGELLPESEKFLGVDVAALKQRVRAELQPLRAGWERVGTKEYRTVIDGVKYTVKQRPGFTAWDYSCRGFYGGGFVTPDNAMSAAEEHAETPKGKDEELAHAEGDHLVMQSGSTFHLTHTGARAIGKYGGRGGHPSKQGDHVRPGTPLVSQLVKLADTGVGNLNKKLRRLHAKAQPESDRPLIEWATHPNGKLLSVGKGRSGLTYKIEKGGVYKGSSHRLSSQTPSQLKAGGEMVHGMRDNKSVNLRSVADCEVLADYLEEQELKRRARAR